MNELKKQIESVENNRTLSSSKCDKEKERLQGMIKKLTDEEKQQTDHVSRVCARVKHERDSWFFPSKSSHLYVRCIIIYCFNKSVHSNYFRLNKLVIRKIYLFWR